MSSSVLPRSGGSWLLSRCRMASSGPMILRSALFGAAVVMASASFPAPVSAQKPITVQEALQRAKPAVVLVVAEVASEVSLDCGFGAGPQKITPPVFRETGTESTVEGDLRGHLGH